MLRLTAISMLWCIMNAAVIHKNVARGSYWSFSDHLDKTEMAVGHSLNFTQHVPEEEVYVEAGEMLDLQCETSAQPTPIITWYFNDRPLKRDEDETTLFEKLQNVGKKTIQHSIVSGRLRLQCPESGIYKCVATNGRITKERTTKVTVVGDSKCERRGPSPPTIRLWTDARFELEFNAVQLMCRTHHAKSIAWYNEDRELLNHRHGYHVLPSGDLVILSVKWSDMGVFTCVASNEVGEERIEAFVYPTVEEMDKTV